MVLTDAGRRLARPAVPLGVARLPDQHQIGRQRDDLGAIHHGTLNHRPSRRTDEAQLAPLLDEHVDGVATSVSVLRRVLDQESHRDVEGVNASSTRDLHAQSLEDLGDGQRSPHLLEDDHILGRPQDVELQVHLL